MRHYYAQIDETGICTGVLDTHQPIDSPRMVPRESADPAVIGKRWNGTAFVPV